MTKKQNEKLGNTKVNHQVHTRIPNPAFKNLVKYSKQFSINCGKPVDNSKLLRLAWYRFMDDLENNRLNIDPQFFKDPNAYIRYMDALNSLEITPDGLK